MGCRRLALRPRHYYGQRRKRTRIQPRTDKPKKSKESTVDATSGEQERRAKPSAVCPGQSRAKEKGKRPETRERKNKKAGDLSSPHSKEEGISTRLQEITESRRTWSPRKSRAHGPESINRSKCHAHRRQDTHRKPPQEYSY